MKSSTILVGKVAVRVMVVKAMAKAMAKDSTGIQRVKANLHLRADMPLGKDLEMTAKGAKERAKEAFKETVSGAVSSGIVNAIALTKMRTCHGYARAKAKVKMK